MASRAGLINRLLTVFLFAAYVTYVLPKISYSSFFGNAVIFGSLSIFAYGASKALAEREDRKYLIVAGLGFLIPVLYFLVLGGS